MRAVNEKNIGEIEERVDEVAAVVVDLTQGVELAEGVGGNGVLSAQSDGVVREADHESSPIEFVTENGFSIVRPWESGNSPAPTGGRYCFEVSDGFIEHKITVELSRHVVAEIQLRTRGRIELSNSFWTICAERHLANYVSEHADFPDNDELIVEKLDGEDVLSALRWEKFT